MSAYSRAVLGSSFISLIALLAIAGCTSTRVMEDTAVLPVSETERTSRLLTVDAVLARYGFKPKASQPTAWSDTKPTGNGDPSQVRLYGRGANDYASSCSARLSLAREQLRVTLQGSACTMRASAIADSLRASWQAAR